MLSILEAKINSVDYVANMATTAGTVGNDGRRRATAGDNRRGPTTTDAGECDDDCGGNSNAITIQKCDTQLLQILRLPRYILQYKMLAGLPRPLKLLGG